MTTDREEGEGERLRKTKTQMVAVMERVVA
jgi:hypothetical protein